MEPFDHQVTAAARMADYRREARDLQLLSAAEGLPRLSTRLPFSARMRVFLTGRIDQLDLPFDAQVRPTAH